MTRCANASRSRRGTTLIELVVSVALLGLIASIATLAARRIPRPDPTAPATIVADSLESVLSSGRPMTLQFFVDGRPVLATLEPDGSVLADSVLRIDRFTGRSTDGR